MGRISHSVNGSDSHSILVNIAPVGQMCTLAISNRQTTVHSAMHVARRVLIVVGFVASWLLLLTRFGQLHFRRSVEDVEEPRTNYVNTIGIVTAILWLAPGSLFFAIVSGRVEHQHVHNALWMSYHLILLLVCLLGGSDLQGAITGVTTFDAVRPVKPGAKLRLIDSLGAP